MKDKEEISLFEKMVEGKFAEVYALDKLEDILGVDLAKMTFDYYDSSIEIYPEEEVDDIIPTEEQNKGILAIGCLRYWINFPDGTERYNGGERRKAIFNRWEAQNKL